MKMHKLMTLACLFPLLAISAIRDGDGNPVTKATQFGNVDGSTGTVGEFLAIGGGGGGGGDVKSVNGHTGVVELAASDVGALPQAWTNDTSISIGKGSRVKYYNEYEENGIAIGVDSLSEHGSSIAIGPGSASIYPGCISIGSLAKSYNENSITIGAGAESHGSGTINLGNPNYTTPSSVYIGNYRLSDLFLPKSGGRLIGPLNIKTDAHFLDSGNVDIGMDGFSGNLSVGTNGIGIVRIGKNNGGVLLVNGTNVMNAISSAGKVKSVNGFDGDVVLSAENVGAPSTNSFNELTHRVELIELTSHPNMTIVGNPTFTEGNVSGFTANDYLVFPTEVSVGTNHVEFYMSFHTGGNVTTQQNLMDSAYGLAFAIRNGTTVTAISTDGQSFVGENTGGTILANHSYRLKLEFIHENGVYSVKTYLADGGGEYTQVGTGITASAPLYPTATYWGGANPGHTTHIFGGSINLSQCWMDFNGKTVWRGYDELPKVSYDPTAAEPLDTAEKIVDVANKALYDIVATNTEVFVTNNLLTISQDGAIKWQESFGGYKMDASSAQTVNCKDHAVTFVTASGMTGLTIVPPGANANGESRDFVVYINTSGTNSLDLTAFTTIYASDVANTNAVKEKLTALYFTELSADVWMLGRQELNRVKP